jgi:S1-C subfamily serine protease
LAAASLLLTAVFAFAAPSRAQPEWDAVKLSVVRIHVTGKDRVSGLAVDNWGTGFFISDDGLLLTAFHVIGRRSSGDKIDWGNADGGKGLKLQSRNMGVMGF